MRRDGSSWGTRGGSGNPHIQAVERFRAALHRAVTPKDFEALVNKLVSMGKKGNVAAIQILFDRVLGKPKQSVEVNQEERPMLLSDL